MAEPQGGRPTSARLLIVQGLVMGLSLPLLMVPGSAVFLDAYGSSGLPWVYLGVGAGGALGSVALARSERRRGIGVTALGTLAVQLVVAVVSWSVLITDRSDLPSAATLVQYNLQVQLGFVFLGVQAGRLFDVQQIKRWFPRIVAAFAGGAALGGLATQGMIPLFGRPEHLLVPAMAAMTAQYVLVYTTSRNLPLPDDPTTTPGAAPQEPTPIRHLLTLPLVVAVFGYQLASAMGTQLVDYLLYDQAAARYDSATELASFMGRFTAALNLTDLIVVGALGALIMSRYGLRFGLGANPVVVTALVAAAVIMAGTGGIYTTPLFLIAGVARVADLTVADLATRTSVNATFQALPVRDRAAAQVAVEGAGVPLALALTAALLLVLNGLSGNDARWVLGATAVLCLVWCALALAVYGTYRRAVADAARRQTELGPDLDLTDPLARQGLVEVAEGEDPVQAVVALRLLVDSDAPEARAVLDRLTAGGAPTPTAALIDLLSEQGHPRAGSAALAGAASDDRDRRRVGLRALGRLGALGIDRPDPIEAAPADRAAAAAGNGSEPAGATAITGVTDVADPGDEEDIDGPEAIDLSSILSVVDPAAADPDPEIASAALAARLVLHTDDATVARVLALADADHDDDRLVAARVLADAAGTGVIGRMSELQHRLARLLGDPDPLVGATTGQALGRLDDDVAAAVLTAALTDDGSTADPGADADEAAEARRARVLNQIPRTVGPRVVDAIVPLLTAERPGRRHPAVRFLLGVPWRPQEDDRLAIDRLCDDELDRIERARALRHILDEAAEHGADDRLLVRRALAHEVAEAQERLLAALGLLHGDELLESTAVLIEGPAASRPRRAMALETLDLTLDAGHRRRIVEALDQLDQPVGPRRHAGDTPDTPDTPDTVDDTRSEPTPTAAGGPPATDPGYDVLVELSVDPGWAAHPDWLQAVALTDLDDARRPSTATPSGPLSSEILSSPGPQP